MDDQQNTNPPRWLWVFITAVLIIGVTFCGLLFRGMPLKREKAGIQMNEILSLIEEKGVDIKEGIIQSPSVILKVHTKEEFLNIIDESNQSTIFSVTGYYTAWDTKYPDSISFYVFNDGVTIAHRYEFKAGRLTINEYLSGELEE